MSAILNSLSGHEIRRFAAGETILHEGGKAGVLLVLIDGAIEVRRGDVPVAFIRDPGAVFGEISALLDIGHTANVCAAEPSSLYVVTSPCDFLRERPDFHLHVSQLLARRMNQLLAYLSDVKAQFEGHDHIGMVDEIMESLVHRQPRRRARTGRAGETPVDE